MATSSSAITSYPPGIYHIVLASGCGWKTQLLTYGYTDEGKTYVTLAHRNVDDKKVHQEWEIEDTNDLEDGTEYIISIPHAPDVFPSVFLTYKGAPEKPKAGDGIEALLVEVPENKWVLKFTPSERTTSFKVAGSDLAIAIASHDINPPLLVLKENDQLEWSLKFLRLSE